MPSRGQKVEKMADQSLLKGQVIGIGKLKIPRTLEFNYEIPMLSFIVIKKPDGSYVSTCIHLLVDGYGTAFDVAVEDMIEAIQSFLRSSFDNLLSREDAWNNLKDLSHSDEHSSPLWNAYRDFQFDLAANGKATDSVEALKKRIRQLNKRIGQLENENQELKKSLLDAKDEFIVDFIKKDDQAA
jgi:hypothetical protein